MSARPAAVEAMESTSVRSDGAMPIRLLKVLTNFHPGGTERQVLNLVRGMDRSAFDLAFACLDRTGEFLESFEACDLPIEEFRIPRLYEPRCFLQQYRFAAHLKQQRVQILHSYNFYANVFAVPAARLAGVPLVLASVRDRGVYLTAAQKKWQRWVLGLADRVLVNADSIRDWLLEQGLREGRISVIRNGIDLSRYQPGRVAPNIRQALAIPESAPLVVLVARLNPSKGIDDFIRAAAMIAPRMPDARFLVVGADLRSLDGEATEDTTYRSSLQQLATSLGVGQQVIFAGHRDDIPDILATAALSVLPSHSEGLSNTLLESMAAGVPIIATDVGGNPELVKEGINGQLVPVRSPEHLAAAMEQLLGDPEQRAMMGERARRMAWSDYSLAGMAAKTQRFYREQLGLARRAAA